MKLNRAGSVVVRVVILATGFAVAYGADPMTMVGLAGLGDLIATCESPLSRNHRAGEMLGQGFSKREVLKRMSQTAEGLASVEPILQLAAEKGVPMPIVQQVQAVIDGDMLPRDIAPHLTNDSDTPQGE